MGPYIVNMFKYNQQDATLLNGIYYYKCTTCFMPFLRPSLRAQDGIHITHNSGKKQKKLDKYPMLCIKFWAPDEDTEFPGSIPGATRFSEF